MLKTLVIGNLGKNAEVRDVSEGRKVISFPVAHEEKYTDKNGVENKRTIWLDCSYFRPADRIGVAQYLTKGTQVYLEGLSEARGYEKKDGTHGAALTLRVRELELLGGKPQAGSVQPTQQVKKAQPVQSQPSQEDSQNEDMPF